MNTTRLKNYFYGLSKEKQESFAKACRTSTGQIKQIISKHRNCNPTLAIDMERESKGKVICDELSPSTDFSYLRNPTHYSVAV